MDELTPNPSKQRPFKERLIFSWEARSAPQMPKIWAVVIAFGFFAFLIQSVHIRFGEPIGVAIRKGSVMQLPATYAGIDWALRAEEGGPFPSRFEPSEWAPLAAIENAAMADLQWQVPDYQPDLKALPVMDSPESPALILSGERRFPKRPYTPTPVVGHTAMQLVPLLYPLSGLTMEELPEKLPVFEFAEGAPGSGASMRFLLRISPSGRVTECIPLAGRTPEESKIEVWLQAVTFPAVTEDRWVALAVGFVNQAKDGSDAH